MKFKSNFKWVCFALFIVIFAICIVSSQVSGFMASTGLPPGQAFYTLSKVLGLTAIVVWGLQMVMGFSQLSFLKNNYLHRYVGIGLVVVIFMHCMSFVVAVSIRENEFTVAPLLINFSNGYYKTGISLGVLAIIFVIIAIFGLVLKSSYLKIGRTLHFMVVPGFVIAYIHAYRIGSDSYVNPVWMMCNIVALVALFYVLKKAWRRIMVNVNK